MRRRRNGGTPAPRGCLTRCNPLADERPVIRALSSLLLACLLWAVALAANPSLHDWVHGEHDDESEHVCLATLLAAGGCDAPCMNAPVVLGPDYAGCVLQPRRDADAPVVFLNGGLPERGPPSRLL